MKSNVSKDSAAGSCDRTSAQVIFSEVFVASCPTSPTPVRFSMNGKRTTGPRDKSGHDHTGTQNGDSSELAVSWCLARSALCGMSAEPSMHQCPAQVTVPTVAPGFSRSCSEDRPAHHVPLRPTHVTESPRRAAQGSVPRSSRAPRSAVDCEGRRHQHGTTSRDRASRRVPWTRHGSVSLTVDGARVLGFTFRHRF